MTTFSGWSICSGRKLKLSNTPFQTKDIGPYRLSAGEYQHSKRAWWSCFVSGKPKLGVIGDDAPTLEEAINAAEEAVQRERNRNAS